MSNRADTEIHADALQAGALLRAARQQQGLHIAALATTLKVTPAKLEALESGRLHELPDATFARVLAKSVCRQLKIDAAPVLALLPGAAGGGLERVDGGLNTPFRERAGRSADPIDWMPWKRPALWAAAALLVAAAAFVLVPAEVGDLSLGTAEPPAPAASMPMAAASSAMELPGQSPAPAEPAASALGLAVPLPVGAASSPVAGVQPAPAVVAPSPAASTAPLQAAAPAPESASLVLKAVQDTWVQVTDAGGQVLMARTVPAGETVAMSPAPPIRLRIGNVRGTVLEYRGRAIDMAAANTGNVANITLP